MRLGAGGGAKQCAVFKFSKVTYRTGKARRFCTPPTQPRQLARFRRCTQRVPKRRRCAVNQTVRRWRQPAPRRVRQNDYTSAVSGVVEREGPPHRRIAACGVRPLSRARPFAAPLACVGRPRRGREDNPCAGAAPAADGASRRARPPRSCFTCGKVIGNRWETYLDLLQAEYSEG